MVHYNQALEALSPMLSDAVHCILELAECFATGMLSVPGRWALWWEASSSYTPPRYSTVAGRPVPGQSECQAEAKSSSSQGTRLVHSRRRAIDQASFRSLNVTRCTLALVARHRSNVSRATPIHTRYVIGTQPFPAGLHARRLEPHPHLTSLDLARQRPQMIESDRSFGPAYAVRLGTPLEAHCSLGCRCGTCNEGYYNVWGQCHECGPTPLVFFLSRALQALGVFTGTAIMLWKKPGCHARAGYGR